MYRLPIIHIKWSAPDNLILLFLYWSEKHGSVSLLVNIYNIPFFKNRIDKQACSSTKSYPHNMSNGHTAIHLFRDYIYIYVSMHVFQKIPWKYSSSQHFKVDERHFKLALQNWRFVKYRRMVVWDSCAPLVAYSLDTFYTTLTYVCRHSSYSTHLDEPPKVSKNDHNIREWHGVDWIPYASHTFSCKSCLTCNMKWVSK